MRISQESTQAKNDIQDADDVKRLVDSFYDRVRLDDVLGVIFNDVAKVDWDEHLPRMYKFWQAVLFNQPGYQGNPRLVHAKVNGLLKSAGRAGIQREDFERWLDLFHKTVDELFDGPSAQRAKYSASRIAQNLGRFLGHPVVIKKHP